MRFFVTLLLAVVFATAANADVNVVVNRADQTVTATIDGKVHVWPTSTGLRSSWTPPGNFEVQGMDAKHRSRLYNWAPMPWSVFFNGHVAFHGTTEIASLGRPASHGCVRLHPAHAQILFEAVVRHRGKASIKVL